MQIANTFPIEYSETIEKIGNKWIEISKKYEEKYDSKDSIHWYIERTNVGALATAIWLCGGVAIEEYPTTKEKDGEYKGRCDLFFEIDNLKAICEAKMKWIEIAEKTLLIEDVVAPINDAIELAKSDSKAHKTNHKKMYATFICSYWKKDAKLKISQDAIEEVLERAIKVHRIEEFAIFKFKSNMDIVSDSKNVCNLAYMVIGSGE